MRLTPEIRGETHKIGAARGSAAGVCTEDSWTPMPGIDLGNVDTAEVHMTDNIQGANTAGILAAGAAGVDSTAEDDQANDSIIARITGTEPVQRDSDGAPVGASDRDADAAPN